MGKVLFYREVFFIVSLCNEVISVGSSIIGLFVIKPENKYFSIIIIIII